MIDPKLSLAISVQSNKGVYALLLGSGVSRSAQIPTGREIIWDLIGKLAKLEGGDCEPDRAAWYKDKYEEYPDYSKLLSQVVYSASERRELLRPYFEPTEEEQEEGLKLSTEAHQAIANLVESGYIRVIITTNFDRLLENALGNKGRAPIVINTEEIAKSALPLITHPTGCIIVKVNGDYLDPQTKNTADELKKYPEPIERLLDRIFDEFGLIVCGWSGDSDIALRAALKRCSNHRYTTYWTDIREPKGEAGNLISLRQGKFIHIKNADRFFGELADNVFALEEYSKPHPLDSPVLAYRVKKYLRDDRCDIRLHDLMHQEVEELYAELSDEEKFPVCGISNNGHKDEFRRHVKHYEYITKPVLAMMITGCRWGKKLHEDHWIHCLERIANPSGKRNGIPVSTNLRLYPALLLLYGGGIISIATENYELFSALLNKPKVRSVHGEDVPLVKSLYTESVIEKESTQKWLPGMEHERKPVFSNYLYKILREPLKDFLPQDTRYQKCFDRFEYLFALVNTSLEDDAYGPIGCFAFRHKNEHREVSIMQEIGDEASVLGDNWPLLKAGLFKGDVKEFNSAKQKFDKHINDFIRRGGNF